MTPQSTFLVVARLAAGREDELRKVLSSMNRLPGMADPQNMLVSFGQFERLHFARFVILDDPTLDDITLYGVPRIDWRPALAFLGDVDGPADEFLATLVQRAGDGLRHIFSHCEGFHPDTDLRQWMKDHGQAPAANNVN
jgi:hypothetical protein